MQNPEIVKIIENLRGRRSYEEKRAYKLGFTCLYDYFEYKISKKQNAIEEQQKELGASKIEQLEENLKAPEVLPLLTEEVQKRLSSI